MNKILFAENLNASNGEVVDIDSESNIIVLCPQTCSLVKTNFDATKLLKCISLKEYLVEPGKIGESIIFESKMDFDFEEDHSSDLEVSFSSDDDSLKTNPVKSQKDSKTKLNYNFISMCLSAITNEIYVLADYDGKTEMEFHIMCFDRHFNFIRKFVITNLTEFFLHYHRIMGCRRQRRITRNLKLKLSCFTNENKETKLYLSTNSGIFVYTHLGLLLGQLDLSSSGTCMFKNFSKIIATKTLTYILCCEQTFGRPILLIFETNIDKMNIKKPNEMKLNKEKTDQINSKIIDRVEEKYDCKGIQTFYGDDLGNVIFIGKSAMDPFIYLYYLNYDGQLIYKTKLFNKIILDITVDNVTSRNYRLIAGVKTAKTSNELMWIYEFENFFAETIGKQIKFQNFPIQEANVKV